MGWNTYGDLLRPASIGSMRLRNRICMAPMDFKYFTGNAEDSTLSFRHAKVFEARAKGGCGLILTCAVQAEREVMPYPYDMQFPLIDREERVKEFAEAADMVHNFGAKIGCELTMGSGRYHDTPVPGVDPIAPSACQTQYDASVRAREMTRSEIARMIETYAAAAGRLKRADFDCLLVMGQGGYLINQFLSSAWNHRTDEYGGSPERRMRFLLETLEAVRAEVGPDYPIILGVNMDDRLPEGVSDGPGLTVDYQTEVALEMERRSLVDAYQLRIGNYYDQEDIVPSAYYDNTPTARTSRASRPRSRCPASSRTAYRTRARCSGCSRRARRTSSAWGACGSPTPTSCGVSATRSRAASACGATTACTRSGRRSAPSAPSTPRWATSSRAGSPRRASAGAWWWRAAARAA